MSKGDANWDAIKKVTTMRDAKSPNTYIIGNGDIKSISDARAKCKTYNVDGVMIGRGIFNNPYLFAEKNMAELSPTDRKKMAIQHIVLFKNTWEENKNPEILKKFFKIYIKDFNGASALRRQLMNAKTFGEMISLLKK
jgi:tRNA-dihydrouridine synthase